MKNRFTRWLPANLRTDFRQYAQTKIEQADLGRRLEQAKALQVDLRGLTRYQIRRLDLGRLAEGNGRKAVLTIAGVAVVGGLAAGPVLAEGNSTSPNVNPAAGAQLRQAAEATKTDVKPLVGQPASDGGQPTQQPADASTQAPANVDKPVDSSSQATQQPAESQATQQPAESQATQQPAAEPSMSDLIPNGTQGDQVSTPLSDDQLNNAKAIVQTAKQEGVGERGAVIGVATSLQESKLNNYGHLGDLNDYDSLGLFQQRPSTGWGTPDQVTNPDYAASAFFNGLKQVDGWQNMPLTDAAQAVQGSAYPFAYAQWEDQAAHIVQDLWNNS